MPLPKIIQRIFNRGLGASGAAALGLHLKLGASSKGPLNEVVRVNNLRGLSEAFGSGPLVDSTAFALQYASPVLVMRIASTGSAAGTVTKTGAGTATLTVSGTALDEYDVVVEVLSGAENLAAAEATFRFSLDGGQAYSIARAVPVAGVYPIPDTGLTITWANGSSGTSFVEKTVWKFSSSAPTTSLSAVAEAVELALKSSEDYRFLHVVGPADTASNAVALAGAVKELLVSAEAAPAYRYVFALLECPDVTRSAAKAAFASFVSDRVAVCYGEAGLDDTIFRGRIMERNAAWAIAARLSAIRPSEDAAWVDPGPLSRVSYLKYNDLEENGEMADARFSTLCTVPKQQGFFVGKACTMAEPGTDFAYLSNRRVMDIACDVNAAAMSGYLNGRLPVDEATGFILESAALAIEGNVNQQLRNALGVGSPQPESDAVAARINVVRDEPILATERLSTQVYTTPYAYAREIVCDQQFTNPAASR